MDDHQARGILATVAQGASWAASDGLARNLPQPGAEITTDEVRQV